MIILPFDQSCVTTTSHIKTIFQYLLLFSLVKQIHSKANKRYDECNQFLIAKDCYFFPCLDGHYSCGRDNHLARFSYDLCSLTRNKYSSSLTKSAQLYFNTTHLCAMTSLNYQLLEEKISGIFTCAHLQQMVFNIYSNCLQNIVRDNQIETMIDFCSIVCENLQTMIDLFLNLTDAFINLRQLLFETGKFCGAQLDQSTGHTIPSLLIAICLDRKTAHLEEDITNIMFNQRFEPNELEWI